jgi:N-acetylglucosamine kinase-like BadF-type ATPase
MEKNILIVDSGATKASWSVSNEGKVLFATQTQGIQPFFLNDQEILRQIRSVYSQINNWIDTIYFYGTGCNTLENRHRLKVAFQEIFPDAQVFVDTDILAAARACCQHDPGVACILGTGSNVCRFDGENIVESAGGLGYILGDEGSGADLGKVLVKNYLEKNLPKNLAQKLEKQYSLSRDVVLHGVYQGQFPNRYMSTFAPFLSDHIEHPFVQQLVKQQFRLFFKHNVLKLENAQVLPIHFVGSVAYFFKDILCEVAGEMELQVGNVIRQPIDGLVKYHEKKLVS